MGNTQVKEIINLNVIKVNGSLFKNPVLSSVKRSFYRTIFKIKNHYNVSEFGVLRCFNETYRCILFVCKLKEPQ